jgi:outer membrane protein TolC
VHDVRVAYYELAYLDQALHVIERNRSVLADVVRSTELRYANGLGKQQQVLEARLDLTRLAQDANALRAQRQAQLAALNALLDRPSATRVDSVRIPARIVEAAVPDSGRGNRFRSDSLGASIAQPLLPPLVELQSLAIANNPALRERQARIAAQAARVTLAQKAVKPDLDVSLQYGQRNGLTDMVSAVVSVPIAMQRSQKQDEDVAAERAELAALEAERRAAMSELRARVAKLYADEERERTQLALDVISVLPQAHATLAAATAEYSAGTGEIAPILQSRSALFTYETSYHRGIADFAETIADLEQTVGTALLP